MKTENEKENLIEIIEIKKEISNLRENILGEIDDSIAIFQEKIDRILENLK